MTCLKVSLKGDFVSRAGDVPGQRNVIIINKRLAAKVASDTVNIHCEECWPKYVFWGMPARMAVLAGTLWIGFAYERQAARKYGTWGALRFGATQQGRVTVGGQKLNTCPAE